MMLFQKIILIMLMLATFFMALPRAEKVPASQAKAYLQALARLIEETAVSARLHGSQFIICPMMDQTPCQGTWSDSIGVWSDTGAHIRSIGPAPQGAVLSFKGFSLTDRLVFKPHSQGYLVNNGRFELEFQGKKQQLILNKWAQTTL